MKYDKDYYHVVLPTFAEAHGLTEALEELKKVGAILQIELYECYNCGYSSDDMTDFLIVNEEQATFTYPGYTGDIICMQCAVNPATMKVVTSP